MAKLGILIGRGPMSHLTLLFTGSRAYHVFWETDEYIYDMNLLRRRRLKSEYEGREVLYKDFPMITQAYLEDQLTKDGSTYGFIDYLMFALRPLYHLVGKSTRNAHGTICSELCNEDLIACGYTTPWSLVDETPSPADFVRWIFPDKLESTK